MQWYSGRTVLITGASRGLGAEFARTLAGGGARLLLTARSEDDLARLATELQAQGTEVNLFPQDLALPGAYRELFDRVSAAGHQVDVLVNNAGFGLAGAFVERDEQELADLVQLNVANLVMLTRLALPGMIARGSGGILNVASNSAFQPVPLMATYAASKVFVKSFSEALHAELRDTGVHVTCLAPGSTASGFFDRAGMARPAGGWKAAPARPVVEQGLHALARNRRLVVTGRLNAFLAAAARLTPTPVAMAVSRRMMELAR